jgi:hypothetical protein
VAGQRASGAVVHGRESGACEVLFGHVGVEDQSGRGWVVVGVRGEVVRPCRLFVIMMDLSVFNAGAMNVGENSGHTTTWLCDVCSTNIGLEI